MSAIDKLIFRGTVNGMKKPTKRGRPRLPKDMARSETLRVRLSKEEKQTLLAAASGEKNASEWARKKLLGEL